MENSRILIVDDLEFMRMAIRDILTSAGFIIIGEAKNGIEAIEKYFSLKPDLVLLDITMPVLDGISALKRIRKKDKTAKIVMCSAMGQDKYILKAIQYGARDFVVKPFKAERIISAVEKACVK